MQQRDHFSHSPTANVRRGVPAGGGGACRRVAATANDAPQPVLDVFGAILVSRALEKAKTLFRLWMAPYQDYRGEF